MNSPSRIGILYSYAPHFTRAVQHVRKTWPEAHIIAFVPSSLPEDTVSAYVDEQMVCVPEPQKPKTPGQAWALVKEIRRQRLDMLVVLFKSTNLQAIGLASGAREICCYDLHGNLAPIRLQPVRSLFSAVVRRIVGELRYRRIWLIVHCTSVTPQPLGKTHTASPENKASDSGE